MELHRMLSGANRYVQGRNLLDQVGAECAQHGWRRIYAVGGPHGLAAAWPAIRAGLEARGISHVLREFTGFNPAGEIEAAAREAAGESCAAIAGIGGGKALDLAKAAAALAGLPVVTVPTSAATCAAFAPLSIVYDEEGRQAESRFHSFEVSAVFVDLDIIAAAPARLLAAGMADALAKSCEYSSAFPSLRYGDIDTAKYCGYRLALAGDEGLLSCGPQAYRDALEGRATQALEDAVFLSIANIGVVSGLCGYTNKPGGRFAIAHGFNELIRGRWVPDPRRWLHGELVAVGILAQLRVNRVPAERIEAVRRFFQTIRVPVSLTQLGMELDAAQLAAFQEEVVANTSMDPALHPRIRQAVAGVLR